MMGLVSLGYVGVGGNNLDDWEAFATRLLGLQVSERARSCLSFRMDDWRQRIIIDRELADGCRYFGWETADGGTLEKMAARVENAGYAVTRAPASLADQRLVSGMIYFQDPAGNQIEVFHGAQHASEPFRPGRSLSGFRTGSLGLGHVVLTAADVDRMTCFYQEVLGFRLSDYLLTPFKAYFYHINPRHHSLAIIGTGQDGMHHLMVELLSLDDVGQGYDIAQLEKGRVKVTLGRHANDYVTSFYAQSPSSFMVEYGCGGRTIDDATWRAKEFTEGPSLWGHERDWLAPDQQAVARDMRLAAAAQGIRAPLQVI
jgi:2,3-dihydroxybiphenyl 1,2-dioxygenase